jgi:hypothetical protein
MVRAEGDFGTEKINSGEPRAGGKIQQTEEAKAHTTLVLGPRDLQASKVSVRLHGKGMPGVKPRAEVVADVGTAIKECRG